MLNLPHWPLMGSELRVGRTKHLSTCFSSTCIIRQNGPLQPNVPLTMGHEFTGPGLCPSFTESPGSNPDPRDPGCSTRQPTASTAPKVGQAPTTVSLCGSRQRVQLKADSWERLSLSRAQCASVSIGSDTQQPSQSNMQPPRVLR